MNVIERINATKGSFTKSDLQIYNHIKKDYWVIIRETSTIEELAKKCGVSRQTVNAIENNKYDPTLALAFRLARELKLTVDELFLPS